MKVSLFISLIFMLNQTIYAQNEEDWPCIQIFVPKISAASIWDGPSVEELKKDKRFSDASRSIITRVIDKRELLTDEMLDQYVIETGIEHNDEALTYLFNEFLKRLNARRSSKLKSIKRYTKSQLASAKSIEQITDQISSLQNQQDQQAQLQELETNLHWQKRMFAEREKSFKHLCEIPQDIAQQMGEIARMISAKLQL